jgi:hypothetical protein
MPHRARSWLFRLLGLRQSGRREERVDGAAHPLRDVARIGCVELAVEVQERSSPRWSTGVPTSGAAHWRTGRMALVRHQLRRIARGSRPSLGTHPARALACDQLAQRRALRRYRSWLRASA